MTIVRTAAQILADIEASGIPDGTPIPGEVADRQIGTHRAAHILAVSPDTVRRWAVTNQLPHSRLGAHLRFWESDVWAIARRRVNA